MRTKSAYRNAKPYRDGGAVTADSTPIAVPPDAADVPDSDDAALAFREQIGNLSRAEEMQRQRPPQQTSRAAMLEGLRQQGLSETAITFLAENPAIADAPALADQAAKAARSEGHEPDTPGFFQSVRSHFAELAASAENSDLSPSLATAEKYLGGNADVSVKDMALLERDQFHRSAAMVSAPVSREVPSSNREDRPGRLTLTVAQREAAKMSGLSEAEYAMQVLRLRAEKAADPAKYGSDR